MDKILAVNIGSASKKYALYSNTGQILLVHFERLGTGWQLTIQRGDKIERQAISEAEYDASAQKILSLVPAEEVDAIGFRIIHGGNFTSSILIDDKVVNQLENIKFLAPLHNGPVLEEIRVWRKLLPNLPRVAVFDSAFHATMPAYARHYGIPRHTVDSTGSPWSDQHKLWRYGFHGISYQSILNKVEAQLGNIPEKTIICHLGSGASIVAVKHSHSIDTSMGLTPLEGLVMGTRAGDIDAGLLLHLQTELQKSPVEIDHWLNFECGLKGLSGKTSDVRELIKLEQSGDAAAVLALAVFSYRVKKYIGSYAAALNGLDLLVFTAAIGEGSPFMRSKICNKLDGLGISLDEEKNSAISDQADARAEGEISPANQPVKIWVLKTDELGQIAHEIQKLL